MNRSSKKVLLRTLVDEIHAGYLPSAGFVELTDAAPVVPLLDLGGRLTLIPLSDLRSIAWVTDFNQADSKDPERLERKAFLARPKAEGLWVRVHLGGGATMEGLAALDVSLLDAMARDRGLFLTPPDSRSNTQRLFFPRTAIVELELLAVVTAPSKQQQVKPAGKASATDAQTSLFPPS